MRSLKTSVIGRSACFQAASLVTSFQVLPSAELHTSRGGAWNESNQPPMIQSWSLNTTSPAESRGCQPAFSVTRTQSGAGLSADAGSAQRPTTAKSNQTRNPDSRRMMILGWYLL